jgi:tRNA (guanine-N7-)-methyltransferase
MSFGLGRGRTLDTAPGVVGLSSRDLPPLPDDFMSNPPSGWIDPRPWFANPDLPFEIEIGSGKGTFLLQHAEAEPGLNTLGIEWEGEFYAYAADRIRRRALPNARMLHADAVEFLRWRIPDGLARAIHLYFSDPWPKRKHHKNRVIQDRFLADAHRILEPGGELRIVTDHDDYWAWMEEHFVRWTEPMAGFDGPPFSRLPFDRAGSAAEGELVGTNFERKYRLEGRPFHAAILRKSGMATAVPRG